MCQISDLFQKMFTTCKWYFLKYGSKMSQASSDNYYFSLFLDSKKY